MFKIFKETNIPKLTIIAPIISLSLLTTLITYFFVKNQYGYFEKEAKEIEIEYIQNQKKIIKDEVHRVIDYINYRVKNSTQNCDIKNEVLGRVANIRFGDNGYIFIMDNKAKIISHPFLKVNNQINLIDTIDKNGVKFIEEIINVSKKENGGYVKYFSKKLDTNKSSQKITYAKYLPEWNWIVGAGVYLDEVEKIINKKKIKLEKNIKREISFILTISLIVTTIITTISILFSKTINSIFHRYREDVKLKELKLKELNKSLEKKVNLRTVELQELNKTLEEKVKNEIKKRRQKDKILIQQSKMASMGEMIANIAHQWRQPLNTLSLIIQSIEMAKFKNTLSDEFLDDRVKKGEKIIEKMSSTIDDFRNFFKLDREREKFNLKNSIEHSLTLIESSMKHLSINININISNDIYILGFKNEFSQVILNLINNSRDEFIRNRVKNPTINIKAFKYEKKIVLIFQDNAGGIKRKIIDKIFEPYFSTKEDAKGTGIGLYMSKTIIENNMNGKLSVKNVKSEDIGLWGGAEFRIELPKS